ncbi:WD40 repeat-like protein [Panus rudis PR-1116 ss-1]|nr:WD40 repeat-like protein [Panus rudis PR-1116 ss-1]
MDKFASDPENPFVTPQKKRSWVPSSVTNAISVKRRRISTASVDLTRDFISPWKDDTASIRSTSTADRFITTRPEGFATLSVTPRTQRIARVFGMIDDKVLNTDESSSRGASSSTSSNNTLSQFRANVNKLLHKSTQMNICSAAAHLNKRQFLLALDGPGVSKDVYAYPISWSHAGHNTIAVACNDDIYYQDLDTRIITQMCSLDSEQEGEPVSLEWSLSYPHTLAIGSTLGSIQLWDAPTRKRVRAWHDENLEDVGAMSWRDTLLTVGVAAGGVGLYDSRERDPVGRLTRHKSKVIGCQWSHNGDYLATSDKQGVVNIWDARAGKTLTHSDRVGKVKYRAHVKALAWCPWKPELLATGSTYPDGKIRIYNIKSDVSMPKPEKTITLHTSVTSLHWSPHCKELLSTQGSSWDPLASSTRPVPVPDSPLSNSIAVHAYPTLKRVITVTKAHQGAIGHSCMNWDGTRIFTLCPAEEAMKMWKVWDVEKETEKKTPSAFDKYVIR